MKSVFILGMFPSRECSCIQTHRLALISPEAERDVVCQALRSTIPSAQPQGCFWDPRFLDLGWL